MEMRVKRIRGVDKKKNGIESVNKGQRGYMKEEKKRK